MSQASAIDFFNPLSQFEGVSILKNCVIEQTIFAINIDIAGNQAIISTKIDNRLLANRFYLIFATEHQVEGKVGSFSFKVGTRIFFFKSEISKDNKGYYILDSITIYELCRRRHERYNIPKEFSQNCSVLIDQARTLKAHIIDLSESGIRIQIKSNPINYEVGHRISVLFQIEKRGEIMPMGIVRYIKKNSDGSLIIGIEFQNLSPLLLNKIKNVCEDLERQLKSKTRLA